jgi:hypothetical protein
MPRPSPTSRIGTGSTGGFIEATWPSGTFGLRPRADAGSSPKVSVLDLSRSRTSGVARSHCACAHAMPLTHPVGLAHTVLSALPGRAGDCRLSGLAGWGFESPSALRVGSSMAEQQAIRRSQTRPPGLNDEASVSRAFRNPVVPPGV